MNFSRVFVFALAALGGSAFAEDWKPLWDGKALAGWHPIGKGAWTIEDGAIVGRHDAKEPEFGHLVTDAVYGDFTVRLKYKTGDLGPLRETGPELSVGFTPARPATKSQGLVRGGFSGKF